MGDKGGGRYFYECPRKRCLIQAPFVVFAISIITVVSCTGRIGHVDSCLWVGVVRSLPFYRNQFITEFSQPPWGIWKNIVVGDPTPKINVLSLSNGFQILQRHEQRVCLSKHLRTNYEFVSFTLRKFIEVKSL